MKAPKELINNRGQFPRINLISSRKGASMDSDEKQQNSLCGIERVAGATGTKGRLLKALREEKARECLNAPRDGR